jgi:hypothetical protein
MTYKCSRNIGDIIWIVRFNMKEEKCACCGGDCYRVKSIEVSREKIHYLSIESGNYTVNFEPYWFYKKSSAEEFKKYSKCVIGKKYNEVFLENVKAFSPNVLKMKGA